MQKRVLEMNAFNSSSSYYLLLACGRNKSMIHHWVTTIRCTACRVTSGKD